MFNQTTAKRPAQFNYFCCKRKNLFYTNAMISICKSY